ncbi:MAG: hypothetical protein ACLSUW_02110 [Akkermansia sp.]
MNRTRLPAPGSLNTDLLQPRQIKPEQRDFMRTLIGWMTDREELRGLGPAMT